MIDGSNYIEIVVSHNKILKSKLILVRTESWKNRNV